MSECVKVVVRCRPLNSREKELGCKNVVMMDQKKNSVQIQRQNPQNQAEEQPKVFTFDAVFFTDSKQEDLYEQTAFPLVEQVFEGYNGTMFAYGQTGCGKSFTMMGVPSDAVLKGVIPRTFDHIINVVNNDESGKTFLVTASYIEIYMEEIRDLLSDNHTEKLDLKEDPNKGVYVKGLNKVIVKSVKEMENLMNKGNDNRVVGATKMNATSSRSHSIFTINVEVQEKVGEEDSFKAGKLNLVDLAGSEKQSKTQAEGARLKEATKINLSLSALGNVISALSSGKGGHIPYRDSKLTRLLQDSLGGNTKTIMMAALSPADDNYEETVSTLRYAARTKNIKNKPTVNMDPKDALLKEYQDEINRLKAMLANGGQLPPDQMAEYQNQKLQRKSTQEDVHVKQFGDHNNMVEAHTEELEAKNQELMNEKQQREKLEQMLQDMEKQQMHGGEPNKDTTNPEQAEKYKKMKARLKKQKLDHEKLRQEQERKEQEMLNVKKNYNSLQEEVEQLRRVIVECKQKIEYHKQEIKDLEDEHELDKEELLETIREQERDGKFNQAIIDMLLSTEELEIVKKASKYREDRNEYVIPPFTFKENKLRLPRLPYNEAMDLVNQDKQTRELTFNNEKQQQQQMNGFGKNPNKRESRYNTIHSNNNMDSQDSDAFYNNDHNQMRGRTSINQANISQQSQNYKIQKMNGTRHKFYSANPHSNGLDSPEKRSSKLEKKAMPSRLEPLDPMSQRLPQPGLSNNNNDSGIFTRSPEKNMKKKHNGVQLNPLNHNPNISNTSQISDNLSGLIGGGQPLRKHNGLAPIQHKR